MAWQPGPYEALRGITANRRGDDLAALLEGTGGVHLSKATARAICKRIETLNEIVRQNALVGPTPDDAPRFGEPVDYR